jgi:phage replication-related protein YjqB (UPF0714/DUF867 family)
MDRYSSYAELSAHERDGHDYRIVELARRSPVVVLAPHGGGIEPMTSEVATAIAGADHSLYCFEGLSDDRPHSDLHITSDRFGEPRARRLVANAEFAVAVHGRLNREAPNTTWLGGLDNGLIGLAAAELADAGFKCAADVTELSGKAPANICNASRSGRGLQLELPRDLRDALRDDARQLQRFAVAIRAAIMQRLQQNVEISSHRIDMR